MEQAEREFCDVHREEPPLRLQQDKLDTHHQPKPSRNTGKHRQHTPTGRELSEPHQQETADKLRRGVARYLLQHPTAHARQVRFPSKHQRELPTDTRRQVCEIHQRLRQTSVKTNQVQILLRQGVGAMGVVLCLLRPSRQHHAQRRPKGIPVGEEFPYRV